MTTQITTTEKTTLLFTNIFAALKAEKETRLQDFINSLNEYTDPFKILESWSYRELLTASKKRMVWEINELKAYLTERKKKEQAKDLQKQLDRLIEIENAPDLVSITVSVEWKKSRTWGANPTAEAQIQTTNGFKRFSSGSISGCGYDKKSTAVAEAINQSDSFKKALYLVKEQNIGKKNHDVFGYGSGYGILPHLEGGVGVSCYPVIFNTIGFEFKNTGSGKMFDVYSVTKK